MTVQKLIFGEWTPDQPGITGGVMDAYNCYPVANGYAPLRSEADYSNDAAEVLLTAFAAKYAGNSYLFAGSANQLYKFNNSNANLDQVSKTSTSYSAVEKWNVTQFGPKVIVANGTNRLQAFDVSASTQFDDLSADAPAAKYVTVVRDFVVGANLAGQENYVYWSDINNEINWTPGAASQADSQALPDGFDITGIAGGEFGIVFLERAIYRMSYVGSPLFFQFDAISKTLGCISSGSIAQLNGLTYFLANDGFYVCDGQNAKPIGAEKVNRWFASNSIPGNLINGMSTVVDPIRNLVVWCFDNAGGGKSLLIYNVQTQKWSYGSTTASSLAYLLTPSSSLDALDILAITQGSNTLSGTYVRSGTTVTVTATNHGLETNAYVYFDATSGGALDGVYNITKINANTFTFSTVASGTITTSNCTLSLPNMENLETTFDSRAYAGGLLLFGGVTDKKIISYSGAYKNAEVTSGDIDIGRSIVTLAKPIVDNGIGSVAIASRDLLSDAPEFGDYYAPDDENRVGLRSAGRYHRIKVKTTSDYWTTLVGCDINIVKQGSR